MTIYLDKRSEEVTDSELTEEEREHLAKAEREIAVKAVMNFIWRVALAPVIFLVLWNIILSPTFGITKIGYFKSLGMLVMASIVLSSIKLEKDS